MGGERKPEDMVGEEIEVAGTGVTLDAAGKEDDEGTEDDA